MESISKTRIVSRETRETGGSSFEFDDHPVVQAAVQDVVVIPYGGTESAQDAPYQLPAVSEITRFMHGLPG